MNNRNISPLYIYTHSKLIDRSVNKATLQKALDAVDSIVTNCCLATKPTMNGFLKGFYAILKTMPKQYSLNKLKAVKTLLTDKIACCN